MLNTIEAVLGLLVAVAVLAVIARKLGLPYPILLVIGGLVLALIPGIPRVKLSPELVFFLFLPPILYPAATFTSWRDFHANLRPISLLAIGLVLFTTVAVGYLAHFLIPELPLAAALAFGAIISPPDAIAATAMAEHLRVPKRILTILEGESLVNDATALVAFRFAVAALVTGTFSLTHAVGQFVMVVVGGALLGVAIGWVSARIEKPLDDPPVEITISILTPFAAYLAAERLHVSGVLAVVTAGLYFGWRLPEVTTSRTRLQAGPVWEMIEFTLHGFIFLLIGLQLPEVMLNLAGRPRFQLLWYAAAISFTVIVVRILWVFPASYLPRFFFKKLRARDPYPAWQHVAIVAWTGMRGVISLAAAMALPFAIGSGTPFPGRDLILLLTFAVILVTLVLQGLSLPWIIRWLGVEDDGSTAEQEERDARLKANQAALARVNAIAQSSNVKPAVLSHLRVEYEDRLRQLEAGKRSGPAKRGHLFSSEYENISYEALQVERETILQLRNERTISDEAMRRIQHDIDLAEARLGHPKR